MDGLEIRSFLASRRTPCRRLSSRATAYRRRTLSLSMNSEVGGSSLSEILIEVQEKPGEKGLDPD